MADEIGENNTPHTHIYFCCSSPVRFTTVKNLFDTAHIEAAHGSSQENRNYVSKKGKWANDIKHGTKVDGTFEEWGEIPEDNRKGYSEYNEIIDRIRDGATNAEILLENPDFFRVMRDVEYVRQMLKAEEYREKWRNIETVYIWGATGVGKTRFVMVTAILMYMESMTINIHLTAMLGKMLYCLTNLTVISVFKI